MYYYIIKQYDTLNCEVVECTLHFETTSELLNAFLQDYDRSQVVVALDNDKNSLSAAYLAARESNTTKLVQKTIKTICSFFHYQNSVQYANKCFLKAIKKVNPPVIYLQDLLDYFRYHNTTLDEEIKNYINCKISENVNYFLLISKCDPQPCTTEQYVLKTFVPKETMRRFLEKSIAKRYWNYCELAAEDAIRLESPIINLKNAINHNICGNPHDATLLTKEIINPILNELNKIRY